MPKFEPAPPPPGIPEPPEPPAPPGQVRRLCGLDAADDPLMTLPKYPEYHDISRPTTYEYTRVAAGDIYLINERAQQGWRVVTSYGTGEPWVIMERKMSRKRTDEEAASTRTCPICQGENAAGLAECEVCSFTL